MIKLFKFFVLFISIFLLFACSKNNQKKAEQSVSAFIKTKLANANSYKSISFGKLDSIFTKFSETEESIILRKQVDSIKISSIVVMFDKNYEKKVEILKNRIDSLNTLYDNKQSLYIPEFIGWSIGHSYSCENKFGTEVANNIFATLDKDFEVKQIQIGNNNLNILK